MSAVVYATQSGDVLRVWVRSDGADVREVLRSTVTVELDPARLVGLVADLDTEFGWSNGATPPPVVPKRVRQLAAATAAKTTPTPKQRRRISRAAAAARRDTIVQRAAERGEIAGDELFDLYKAGTGTEGPYKDLRQLVDEGRLERSGIRRTHGGAGYRWRLPHRAGSATHTKTDPAR